MLVVLPWLRRDWTVKVEHVLREGNRAADLLAGVGRRQAAEFKMWEMPPESMGLTFFEDSIGIELPRGL